MLAIEIYRWPISDCNGCTVLKGVTVATGCVIASGAVVTRSTEPYGIYGGVPARRIAERFKNNDED